MFMRLVTLGEGAEDTRRRAAQSELLSLTDNTDLMEEIIDQYVVNFGFDESCRSLTKGGSLTSRLQGGRIQSYLRFIGAGLVVLVLFLIWGCRSQ